MDRSSQLLEAAGTSATALDRLRSALSHAWERETSYYPGDWSPKNPAWGQCAVTALVAQDLLGGELMSGQVNGHEHYWNRLASGEEVDLTKEQFEEPRVQVTIGPVDREEILEPEETSHRYLRLRKRILAILENEP